MKKNFRRFAALALALVMMFAMSATAFASSDYPYLTNTTDTNYSYTVQSDEDAIITLKVVPANSSYARGAFTYAEAQAITWGYEDGSDEENIILDDTVEPVAVTGGYAACVDVYVFSGGTPGASSIYAQNTEGNKMNFTIVVDGTSNPVNNVSYVFYNQPNASTSDKLLTVNNMTVSGNDHYGSTNYPSVLDGIYGAWMNTLGSENRLTNYVIQTNYGTDMLTSLTFEIGGTLTNYTEGVDEVTYDYGGWQYRVYRSGSMVPLSEMVGAGEFNVKTDDVVVWKYGKYGEVSFPATYSLAA